MSSNTLLTRNHEYTNLRMTLQHPTERAYTSYNTIEHFPKG